MVSTDQDEAVRGYFERLLGDDGNELVDAGLDVVTVELPPWFNEKRFRRGQQFMRDHLASMHSGMFMGLVALLAIPTILDVLVFTGKSGAEMDAYRRYVKTLYHVLIWFDGDLKPGSEIWNSIEIVRKKHLHARRACEHTRNLAVTLRDMVITQFGFMGYAILRPKMIGIHVKNEKDFEDFVYFWRVIGYLLGIKDELNLCKESLAETVTCVNVMMEKVIRPRLESPVPDFEPMVRALTEGVQHYMWNIEYDIMIYLAKRFTGLPDYEYFKNEFDGCVSKDQGTRKYYELTRHQRFKITLYVYLHEYGFQIGLIKWFFNMVAVGTKYLSYYFPLTAIYTYGYKKAYVRIFKASYRNKG